MEDIDSFYNFAPRINYNDTIMKKSFILSLLFIFAVSAYAHQNTMLRGDTIDIIIIDPDGPLPGPYLAPKISIYFVILHQLNNNQI